MRLRAVLATLAAIAIGALALHGCGQPAKAPRLLVVGIDGADWAVIRPLLAEGELPHLLGLIQAGRHGPLRSVEPTLPALLWTTLATGCGPEVHGVVDVVEPGDGGMPALLTSAAWVDRAFWSQAAEQGLKVCVVGWPITWPAGPAEGIVVSDRALSRRFPAQETVAQRVWPAALEPDVLEWIERAARFKTADARRFIDVSDAELAASPAPGVGDPVAGLRLAWRNLQASCEVAVRLQQREAPDVLAVCFEGLDTASHVFMPYAPPARAEIPSEEQRRYGRALAEIYKLQDELLGRLLALADDSTTVAVISGHGFRSGAGRPPDAPGTAAWASTRWHHPEGIVLLSGPRVGRADPPILERASIFDIAPTLLALIGLAPPAEIEGRVLAEALADGLAVAPPVAAASAPLPPDGGRAPLDPPVRERLAALGYLALAPNDGPSRPPEERLVDHWLSRGRPEQAREVLLRLIDEDPRNPGLHLRLGLIHLRAGELSNARLALEAALERDSLMVEARMNLAYVHRELGNKTRAIALLDRGRALHPEQTGLRINLGMLYAETNSPERAEQCYAEALALQPDHVVAHSQLALLLERRGLYEQALGHWEAVARVRPEDRTARDHIKLIERLRAAAGAAPEPEPR